MKENFIIIFDIPRKMNTLRNRVHRKLVKFDVKKVQDSAWSSQNIALLSEIATEIKKEGASAQVFKIERIE